MSGAERLAPYVPDLVLRRLGESAPFLGAGERLTGVVSFCDISGFTPMTEALNVLGKEGAEILTTTLNEIFAALIETIHRSGGDVLKFGGDALTVLHQPLRGEPLETTTLRAVETARALQSIIATRDEVRTKAGVFRVAMKIGMGRGELVHVLVGREQGPLEPVFAGPPLDFAADAEHHAKPGQVVFPEDWALGWTGGPLGDRSGDGFAVIGSDAVEGSVAPLAPFSARVRSLPHVDRLRPFIPPALADQVLVGASLVGDIRRAAVMFLQFAGLHYAQDAAAPAQLQDLVLAVQDAILPYGGCFSRLDTGDKGSKIVILFGAPQAVENPEERAARAALGIAAALRGLPFDVSFRIGVTAGNVFAGNVGSSRRQEYTVMGDIVNLSARLMTSAEQGGILVSAPIAERASRAVDFSPLFEIRVKGKSAAVQVAHPVGLRAADGLPSVARSVTPLVGRLAEMQAMEAWLASAARGHGRIVFLAAEGGMGKTRLARAWADRAREHGFSIVTGSCDAFAQSTSYQMWRGTVRAMLGMPDTSSAISPGAIGAALAERIPAAEPWAPLIGDILGIPLPDTSHTRALDPKARSERTFALVVELARAWSRRAPLHLTFDDVQWADSISLELLDHVARAAQGAPIVIVAVHRPEISFARWEGVEPASLLTLTELSAPELAQLAAHQLGVDQLPAELAEFLAARAQGNPFYVEELLHLLLDEKHLQVRNGQGELTGDLGRIQVPDTIQGVLLTRLDRLPPVTRNVARVAACVGRSFRVAVLAAALPEPIEGAALETALEQLQEMGLTLLDRPDIREYYFRHVLVQDVAYENLLFGQRRVIHGRIADHYEAQPEGSRDVPPGVIARHLDLGAQALRAIPHYIAEGQIAAARYANREALHAYSRVLALAAEPENQALVRPTDRIEALLGKASADLIAGRLAEAENGLLSAHRASAAAGNPALSSRALTGLGRIFVMTGAYSKAGAALNAVLTQPSSPPAARAESSYLRMVVLTREGATDSAMAALQGLIQLERQTQRPHFTFLALPFAASAAMDRGDRSTAEKCLALLDELAGGATDPYALLLQQFLRGRFLVAAGNPQDGIPQLEDALASARLMGNVTTESTVEDSLASAYLAVQRMDDAERHYTRRLELAVQLNDLPAAAGTRNNLGVLAMVRGDLDGACAQYLLAREAFQRAGIAGGEASAAFNLAEAELARANYPDAEQWGTAAARFYMESGDSSQAVEALQMCQKAAEGRGDDASARGYQSQIDHLAPSSSRP